MLDRLGIDVDGQLSVARGSDLLVVGERTDGRISKVSRVIPALATTTSTGPYAASTSVKAASTDAASVTSARTVRLPSGPEPLRAVTATR